MLCGAAFDSTQSLVAGNYIGELQKIGVGGGQYRWPAGNYSVYSAGAPDYTSAAGVAVSTLTGTWRWVTFKFSAFASNMSAFTLALTNPGSGYVADGNKVTAAMQIFTKVVGSSGTGWLNANAAYSGTGTPVNDGDAAMSAGDAATSATSKRVTFGPVPRTGDLYVRIGVQAGSGLTFAGITVA